MGAMFVPTCCGRCRGDLAVLPLARTSKTLKDGLSGPLSIATMVMRWVFLTSGPNSGTIREVAALEMLESGKPLHIVVVGATAANEEVRSFVSCFLVCFNFLSVFHHREAKGSRLPTLTERKTTCSRQLPPPKCSFSSSCRWVLFIICVRL